jgi:hypothetical protein
MKTYWEVEVYVYIQAFFDLNTRWRWVVSFTPQPLYPQLKNLLYPLDRRLGGPQSRSGVSVNFFNSYDLYQFMSHHLWNIF